MNWEPPSNWHRFVVIDAHTGGEPLRVIVQGFPPPAGATMLEKRRDTRDPHIRVLRRPEDPFGEGFFLRC